ncbi:MAG TPA: NADH-quinone oxidoreductase subunit C [Elusimicrobiota bacterium]|nr:NADH-quinone oxidoreductase subunit C [Elusimicrobiota bacterium]
MSDPSSLIQNVRDRFPSAEVCGALSEFGRAEEMILVPLNDLEALAVFLKEDMKLDFLNFVTAVDWIKNSRFELVYLFQSIEKPERKLFVKVRLARDGGDVVPSLTALWPSADWQEREIFDLFGIRFGNHPNLKRILLWDEFEGHPLRKDYAHVPDGCDSGQEIGVPVSRAGNPHA